MSSFKKSCCQCKKKILRESKGVLLATFDEEKTIEKKYFHFECYLKWFNDCVNNHANEIIDKSAKKIFNQFPKNFQGLIEGIYDNGIKEDNSG